MPLPSSEICTQEYGNNAENQKVQETQKKQMYYTVYACFHTVTQYLEKCFAISSHFSSLSMASEVLTFSSSLK